VKEEFIKNAPLFAEFTDTERRAVGRRMRLETYQADELIFGQGTESDALYLVEEGWVKLTDDGGRTPIATLGPGSLLGETDFFVGRERTMTARANSPLSLWVLDENAVLDLIEEHNQIGLKLGLALGIGIAQYQRHLMQHLGHISFMQDLDEEERRAVAKRLAPQRYATREAIFRSGDAASGLYLIETGSVRLIGDGDDDYTELGPGSTFGEMAVLSNKPHPNTAQAATEVIAWQLSPSDFARLAEAYPRIRALLSRNLRSRLSAADLVQAAGMLQRVPIFANLPRDVLDEVASHLLLRHTPAGEVIYAPGDPGDAMYFVESGQVEITTEDEDRREMLARLIPGDSFGDMALLTGKSRTVTARAVTHSNLWALYRTDFDNLLVKHPILTVALSDTLRERLSQAEGSFVAAHLHKIALLGGLTRVQLDELAERLQPQTYRSGDIIYAEGRTGDTMYFIEAGQVERTASSPRGPVVLEVLESGDFLGEIALLTGKPHIATARVVTESTLWALKKPDFDDLVFRYPNLAVILGRVLSERQYEAMEKLRLPVPAPVRPQPAPPQPRPQPALPLAARSARPATAAEYPLGGVYRQPTTTQPPTGRATTRRAAPRLRPPSRPSATRGISRGAGRLSRKIGGFIGEMAVWFATRSPRVKLGILVLLVLIIWLIFIAAPSSIIRTLSANLNGGENDPGYAAYARADFEENAQSPMLILKTVRDSGAVAALPFVETVTATPSPTATPTNDYADADRNSYPYLDADAHAHGYAAAAHRYPNAAARYSHADAHPLHVYAASSDRNTYPLGHPHAGR
jgi:CRP-like cAMP-binding protein